MFLTTNTKAVYLTSNFYIKLVTYVKTTPVAKTIVKFYEIARFSLKTTPFYKKRNYPFLQKTTPLLQKTLDHLLIENSNLSNQHLQKTQFLEIIETPVQDTTMQTISKDLMICIVQHSVERKVQWEKERWSLHIMICLTFGFCPNFLNDFHTNSLLQQIT